MIKTKINLILSLAIFFFAGLVLFLVCRRSNQSAMSTPLSLQFVGEYSQGDGGWQSLNKETDLSSYNGDVVLRGRFDIPLGEGADLKFYLNHIAMSIYVNTEKIYESIYENHPDMCGNAWVWWELPHLTEEDIIEIRLHNPHRYGNKEAYNEFLDTLYVGSDVAFKHYYDRQSLPFRFVYVFILVASIALVGMAVGYQLFHLPNSILLLKLGMMSLFMSMYMYFDAKDIELQSAQLVFNTHIRQLSMMLAAWGLGTSVTELLEDKQKKLAKIIVHGLTFADFFLMALSLARVMGIYDTGLYWAVIQGTASFLLLVLSIMEVKKNKKKWIMLISAIVLLIVLIAELLNTYIGWWKNGICIKPIFVVFFIFHLLRAVKLVAINYQASIQAKELEEELRKNRLALAMSQIQPHFIYNSLNSIYHLCDKDIEMAQQAISDFSDYLRQSLSVVNHTALISFEEELSHVKTYLKLEQLRFGKDLNVIYHIGTTEFMLPALSVQPLVENAVKHGICQKGEEGGTVILTAEESSDCFEIIVSDDGIGFAPEQENRGEGAHVGIRNVRQRLQIMCNATLEIRSNVGKGTTSTIRIPKGE